MTMEEFAFAIEELGGKAFFVGGCVRDLLMNVPSHDHDILIVGVDVSDFEKKFSNPKKTGKAFPVYRLEIDEEQMEVAFARKEKSTGVGHSDYAVDFSQYVTLEEDLFRRDVTMNAMAKGVLEGEIIDPFNGKCSINSGVISAVSEHFLEDPLRCLRVARQAAKFNMSVDGKTIGMMSSCHESLKAVSMERIIDELKKALATKHPSIFFKIMKDAKILDVCFPEIFALVGQTQPAKFHPEGDAFNHTMLVLDAVSSHTDDVVIRMSALFHDVGKGVTPKNLLPKHLGHDIAGEEILRHMNRKYGKEMLAISAFVARHHMAVMHMNKAGKIVDILVSGKRLPKAITALREVVSVDAGKTPWFLKPEVVAKFHSTKIVLPEEIAKADIRGFVHECQARTIRELAK